MKNTSRKSVQDRLNLMWKRISNARYVHRKLRSVLAFKYPDLKMPQSFEGNGEECFSVCVCFCFFFLGEKNEEEKGEPGVEKSHDQHNYNLRMPVPVPH